MVRSYEELEEAVREALLNTDKSERRIADDTGISYAHINYFKNRKRNLTFPRLHTLAGYLGIKYNLKN